MKPDELVWILLADDHLPTRDGVRRILEAHPRFKVVSEVADGDSVLRVLEATEIDVLVLDLSGPDQDDYSVLRRVRRLRPALKVLILSVHSSPAFIFRAAQENADAYVLKDAAGVQLIAGIEAMLAGAGAGEAAGFSERLTEREREILVMVAEGYSTKQIAGHLYISTRTVDTHRGNLMRKLGLHSVALLTRFAIREGFVATR